MRPSLWVVLKVDEAELVVGEWMRQRLWVGEWMRHCGKAGGQSLWVGLWVGG